MMYRFYVDNVLFQEPEGWDKFSTDIRRDISSNYIVVNRNLTLTFGVTGYNYFYGQVSSTSGIGKSTILIENSLDGGATWSTFHNGLILHSDLRFDEKRKEVNVSVQDNSYYAYVNNNLDVGAYLFAGKSKNNTLIPQTPRYTFQAYDITNVPYPPNTTGGYEYQCYKVFDVFRYLIDFISDGQLNFQSNTFDVGGDYHDYFITTGFVLKYSILDSYIAPGNPSNPAGCDQTEFQESWKEITFKQFYSEMHKRFNLIHWIEYSGGVPTFRIEKEDVSRSTNAIPISNHYLDDLTFEFDKDYLFSTIKCGQGAETELLTWTAFPHRTRVLGFREEEFTLNYQSNLNKVLDLKSEYIHDHNTIMNCLDQGWGIPFGDEFNQDIFIFNATVTAPLQCSIVMSNWLAVAPPYYMNEQLNNKNIVQRFQELLPVPVSQIFTPSVITSADVIAAHDPLDAYPTAVAPAINEPVQFSIDTAPIGYDPNNSWGNGTSTPVSLANSRYTAQYQGLHNFKFYLQVVVMSSNSPQPSSCVIGVNVYDAGNVYQSTSFVNIWHQQANFYPDDEIVLAPVFMDIGWYAQVFHFYSNFSPIAVDWQTPSFTYPNLYNRFVVNEDQIAIPQSSAYNPPYWKYKFKVPMNESEFQLILNDLPSRIPFRRYGDAGTRYGWIKSMKYNHKECIATFELISQKQ